MRYLSLILTLLITAQMGICADGDLASALKTSQGEPNFLSVLISLIIVIALIYITGIIYTKLNIVGAQSVKKQFKNNSLDKIIVLSTTQLGQNKNLHIIEINDKKMLIGATQHSINLIKELTDENLACPTTEVEPKKTNVMDTLFDKKNSDFENLKNSQQSSNYVENLSDDFGENFGLYKKYLNK